MVYRTKRYHEIEKYHGIGKHYRIEKHHGIEKHHKTESHHVTEGCKEVKNVKIKEEIRVKKNGVWAWVSKKWSRVVKWEEKGQQMRLQRKNLVQSINVENRWPTEKIKRELSRNLNTNRIISMNFEWAIPCKLCLVCYFRFHITSNQFNWHTMKWQMVNGMSVFSCWCKWCCC